MSNKSQGNKAEILVSAKLRDMGFWVHRLTQNAAGQPADIIAVRNGIAYLVEVKHCSYGRFNLKRVEDNQKLAMKMWKDRGNTEPLFAFVMPNLDVAVMEAYRLFEVLENKSVLNEDYITHLQTLEQWEKNNG